MSKMIGLGYFESCKGITDKKIKKILIVIGVSLLFVNTLMIFRVNNILTNFFSGMGAVISLLLIFNTSKCRELLVLTTFLSALPVSVLLIMNFNGKEATTSLGGWVWLFSKMEKSFDNICNILGFIGWFLIHIVLLDMFCNDKRVASFISNENENKTKTKMFDLDN